MARTFEAVTTTEPFDDGDYGHLAESQRFGVFTGCGITYDGSDLTFDVAAGTIIVDGAVVQVAAQANAGTFVPDGSNPLWAMITIDSSGNVQLTHGTAAGTPVKPDIPTDETLIAYVLVNNGDATASAIDTAGRALDKRIWINQIAIRKTADESVTSSTTLQDDDHLKWYAEANQVFAFEAFLEIDAGTTEDFKQDFSVPAGATGVYLENSGGGAHTARTVGTAATIPGSGAGTSQMSDQRGRITNGGTAGEINFQFAQQTSGGTATQLLTDSYIIVTRLN